MDSVIILEESEEVSYSRPLNYFTHFLLFSVMRDIGRISKEDRFLIYVIPRHWGEDIQAVHKRLFSACFVVVIFNSIVVLDYCLGQREVGFVVRRDSSVLVNVVYLEQERSTTSSVLILLILFLHFELVRKVLRQDIVFDIKL